MLLESVTQSCFHKRSRLKGWILWKDSQNVQKRFTINIEFRGSQERIEFLDILVVFRKGMLYTD